METRNIYFRLKQEINVANENKKHLFQMKTRDLYFKWKKETFILNENKKHLF